MFEYEKKNSNTHLNCVIVHVCVCVYERDCHGLEDLNVFNADISYLRLSLRLFITRWKKVKKNTTLKQTIFIKTYSKAMISL